MTLHLTKVAVGCDSVDFLAERLAGRAVEGETWITTRFKPKQADETIGGSLYWILKHRLVCRNRITGYREGKKDDGTPCWHILLEARTVPVRDRPKRAHQGWRYLADKDAPADLAGEADTGEMPADMIRELSGLGLL